jgi:hypothetical protein
MPSLPPIRPEPKIPIRIPPALPLPAIPADKSLQVSGYRTLNSNLRCGVFDLFQVIRGELNVCRGGNEKIARANLSTK